MLSGAMMHVTLILTWLLTLVLKLDLDTSDLLKYHKEGQSIKGLKSYTIETVNNLCYLMHVTLIFVLGLGTQT